MSHSEEYEVDHGGNYQVHTYQVGAGCVMSDLCHCEPYLSYTAPNGNEVWVHKAEKLNFL